MQFNFAFLSKNKNNCPFKHFSSFFKTLQNAQFLSENITLDRKD